LQLLSYSVFKLCDIPHPRTFKTQKTCSNPACRAARKRSADQSWRRDNPGWSTGRQRKVREWSAQYPDYWRAYRARERERMRKYRVLSVAKQDAMSKSQLGPRHFYAPAVSLFM
jgi:hypothetical protein